MLSMLFFIHHYFTSIHDYNNTDIYNTLEGSNETPQQQESDTLPKSRSPPMETKYLIIETEYEEVVDDSIEGFVYTSKFIYGFNLAEIHFLCRTYLK